MELAGPVLASGYRLDPTATAAAFENYLRKLAAVRNLVGNAIEHGAGRPVEITLAANRTAAGRPTSTSASSAARTVRPEKSTSSTSTMTLPSTPPAGMDVG